MIRSKTKQTSNSRKDNLHFSSLTDWSHKLTRTSHKAIDRCYKLMDGRYKLTDRGSVESGLTIIPTTAFFLLILQLVLSGSFQVIEVMNLQSYVTRQALGQKELIQFNHSNRVTYRSEELNLPGGGRLIAANSVLATPQLSNLIGFKPKVKAQAIAIGE